MYFNPSILKYYVLVHDSYSNVDDAAAQVIVDDDDAAQAMLMMMLLR